MRPLLKFIIFSVSLFLFVSCAGETKPSTPVDTFKAYTLAYKKKDTTTMKMLLSNASLKMAEQQAQAQNITVDDVVKNEMLFSENQKDFFFRNEKIEGERATIEVKNSFDSWNVMVFVLEEGVWKIDKQGMAMQIQQQNDLQNKQLDNLINSQTPQDGSFNPSVPQNGGVNPNNSPNLTISPNPQPNDTTVNPNVSPNNETKQENKP